jgi:hypothetical protein
MSNSQKPNFFIVGAPRCGTTAMHRYLGAHPRVRMSRKKEPTYFGSDLRLPNVGRPTLDDYLANFSGKDGAIWRGEASVAYLFSRRAAAEIKAFCPEARILIQLRDPVEYLYSFHHIAVYTGQEDIRDFAAALAAAPLRRQGLSIPRRVRILDFLDYLETARFSEQVTRYLDVLGAERVKILLLDDLRAHPAAVYGDVLAFLGLSPDGEREFPVVNACRRLRSPALRRLSKGIQAAVAHRLGAGTLADRACRRLLRPTDRWNLTDPTPMDRALRNQLIEQFEPEVRRLGALLGRDLSHWSKRV